MRITLLLLILSAVWNTNAQWLQTNGPERGFIYCFDGSGTDLFAGSHGSGVFRSTNAGESWRSVNNGITCPDFNAVKVLNSSIFAGSSYKGVFKSTDNGEHWNTVNNGLTDFNIRYLYCKEQNIYAGTSSGIFVSSDYGANWTSKGLAAMQVISILITDSVLIAGTNSDGIYFSTNSGLNWTQRNNGLVSLNVMSLEAVNNNLYAGTGYGVFRSSDGGANWIYFGLWAGYESHLVFKSNVLYNGSYNSGVYRSTNYGLNWVEINNGLSSWLIHSLYTDGENLFAGTEYGLFKSTDNGNNWVIKNSGVYNELVISLAACGPYIFAGTESNGLFRSSDSGLNWETAGLAGKSIFALEVHETSIYAGTVLSGGVYVSTDYGLNWTQKNNGLTDDVILSLVLKEGSLFAGTGEGVYRSTNDGDDWIQVNNGITNFSIYAMTANSTDVYAGSNEMQGGIYRSTNNGNNWTVRNRGLKNRYIHSLLISGPNTYAGTEGGVFLTSNSGDNWSSIGLSNKTVYSLYESGNDIFAGTSSGVYIYNKCSRTWFNRNQGFNIVPRIYCLINSQNYLLAGTGFQSVWRRAANEVIGIEIKPDIIPSTTALHQNYPNPFNPETKIVYSITKTSDVTLKIYDATGKEISTIVSERQSPGTYETVFNASALSSGVYFYRLTAGNFSETRKMVVIK